MKYIITVVLISSLALFGINCASMNNKQKGAAIGGAGGAVVGGVIGKAAGNTAVGAILGAAIGGAAGIYIGNRMDKQAEEMQEELADVAEIERIGEGIKITFDSGILFAVNKATLTPASKASLSEFAESVRKYSDTNILIEGHTDATGTEEYNLSLSRQRAQSVANYLAQLNVDPTRFTIMGYGESQPVSTNDTAEGRQQNRRVEIAIMANEELKQEALRKTS